MNELRVLMWESALGYLGGSLQEKQGGQSENR